LNAGSANVIGLLDANSARIDTVVANTSLLSGTITANTTLNTGSANIVNLLTAASINVTTLNATTGNLASIYINNTQILGAGFALPVSFGGTGLQTVTANAVLFGNGTDAFGITNAPTAGQVLQYRTDGVKFGGLDGGTF
jgi:prophage DNA circulation protein